MHNLTATCSLFGGMPGILLHKFLQAFPPCYTVTLHSITHQLISLYCVSLKEAMEGWVCAYVCVVILNGTELVHK